MLKGIAAAVIVAVLLAGGFALVRWRQEATAGTGPVASATAPEGPTREIAFVSNAVGGTVSLVDVAARQIIGEIDIIPDGAKVGVFRDWNQALIGQPGIEGRSGLNRAQDTDLSPDGRVLYVARGHMGDVAAFDIATGALMWRVPIAGPRADHMTITPDGRRLFVSALLANQVEVIDTTTARKVGGFVAGAWPHDNHMSYDGARLYNASIGNMGLPLDQRDNVEEPTDEAGYAYQVTVVDPDSLEVLARHRFDKGVRPIALTADETMLFAQQSNTHDVIAYDLEASAVVQRLSLPVAHGVTEDDWDFESPHHGLALTPDGRTLCIAGRASDYVGLVAAPDLALIATVPAGDAPSWSEIAGNGEVCVVANSRSDDVSIVSIAERTEIARLPAGRGPKHITVGQVPESVLAAFSGES